MTAQTEQRQGVIFALLAFFMWGLAPMYFKQLMHIDAVEILVHRVVWSVLFLALIIAVLKQWHKIQHVFRNPKILLLLVISASLLGFNWGLFIWSVNNDHLLDASLGYYINPLLNVALGMLFLGETLRRWQGVAVVLAATGVLIQVVSFGSFPWIACSLAASFAVYGLIRKKIPVDSIPGLLCEALILLPAALIYWWFMTPSVTSDMAQNSTYINLMLISAGVVTTLPLLCFTAGAKRLSYATLGFFQYIGPSIMFVLAVYLYNEPVNDARLSTFAFIWSALALYTWDSMRAVKEKRRTLKAQTT